MRHLTEGTLRRMYDDPHSVDEDARRHFAGCEGCQERFAQVAGDARQAGALFQVPGVTVDAQAAYARLRPKLRERPAWVALPGLGKRPSFAWRKPAAAAAVAVGMAAVLAFTPLAGSLHTLLAPQQVQPIPLSMQDMNSLQPLASYGEVRWQARPQVTQVASAAEAAKQSGMLELNPHTLAPSIAGKQATYETVNASTASFTFSEASARAAAQKAGKTAPTFPAGVDGSTLVVQSGPGQAVVYGDLAAARQVKGGENPQQALQQVGPMLVVGAMKAPSVSSTGVDLAQLKQVLLSQPGLSDSARAAISSLDTTSTLPIPIPMDQASSKPYALHGVQGTEFGDNTGLGAGVIWIKDGVLYFVAGTVSQKEAESVASGLPPVKAEKVK